MDTFTDKQEMISARSLAIQRRGLTKRAPDAGDSAHISSSFLRLTIFPVGRLRRPRPSAGNANRWLALCKTKYKFRECKMKNKVLSFSVILILVSVLLSACGGQFFAKPTSTPVPTSTITPTPLPTSTPTVTATTPPTETPIPQPASLTGTIFLSSNASKPFTSMVELRQKGSFTLIGKSETDSSGVYKIENIDPGSYELWVLITIESKMVSGCADVALPNDSWKIGIKFGEDKAMSMENAYLSKALFLMQNMPSGSGLNAEGFYAVLEGFKIESGIENKMDVTLTCK